MVLLHRFLPALLRGFLTAFLLRDTHSHFIGDSDAALFGQLEARLGRHLLALGVSDHSADLKSSCGVVQHLVLGICLQFFTGICTHFSHCFVEVQCCTAKYFNLALLAVFLMP